MATSVFRRHWQLDPLIVFLNHGSFGATPRGVLDKQSALRQQMELDPVRFFIRELEPLMDDAREEVAQFVGAEAPGLVFVPNATSGVNAVLRSMQLGPGDELLTTNHAYNASRNTLEYVAARSGASVAIADVPFPLTSPAEVVTAIERKLNSSTRLLLVDHITSPTALIFPVAEIIQLCKSRGIEVLVDGAHAPGMVPLDLTSLGATYYAANLHKWVCAPKGAAFLWVSEERRSAVRPTSISHGANSKRTDRSRFQIEFDWTGTDDPTAVLSAPASIEFLGGLLPGGWPELMRHNHTLAMSFQSGLCKSLGIDPPAPDSMIGSMAAVQLPDGPTPIASPLSGDALQDALLGRYGIEIPLNAWPSATNRVLRASAQIYNSSEEIETLTSALTELLDEMI